MSDANERAAAAPDAADAGPDALLAALLAALRRGTDAGATALYAALTLRARAPLGDVDGARRALANALLAPLAVATSVAVAPWDRRGAAARTTVAVDGPAGPARYLVSARADDDGWRLTGLRRDDLPLA
ncbi:MAG: hypothetical protein P1P87_16415 [Trueperaceae bacterium]|nr:hypothetical protein [Trueperaceae bacterium]